MWKYTLFVIVYKLKYIIQNFEPAIDLLSKFIITYSKVLTYLLCDGIPANSSITLHFHQNKKLTYFHVIYENTISLFTLYNESIISNICYNRKIFQNNYDFSIDITINSI